MNLFEYQGKKYFKDAGIIVPRGVLISNAEELLEFKDGGVVKAQVLVGGRGKAGAVRKCDNHAEVRKAVTEILGMNVKGHTVKKVLIEEVCEIKQEYYFSIFIDRKKKLFTMMFTDKGGVDIESVDYSQIGLVDINPLIGLKPYMVKKLLFPFGLDKDTELKDVIFKAYGLFAEKGMEMLEINPLVRRVDDNIMALDAKVILDDANVEDEIYAEDMTSGDLTEFERRMATEYDLTAVEMDGDIVILGAGAGVSMATSDSICRKGGSVRAIIDLGILPSDSADEEKSDYAAGAFRLLLTLNPKVILINEYYQAGRLDYEARTLKKAFAEASKTMPIIMRCKGRKAAEAFEILKDTDIIVTDSYNEAVDLAIQKAKEGK